MKAILTTAVVCTVILATVIVLIVIACFGFTFLAALGLAAQDAAHLPAAPAAVPWPVTPRSESQEVQTRGGRWIFQPRSPFDP